MTSRPFARLVAILSLFLFGLAAHSEAQLAPIPQDTGAVGLGLALRHLPVVGSMFSTSPRIPTTRTTACSPWRSIARRGALKTNLYTLTRGDGGQNEIGPELFQAIGVLRTEELNAVHRYDARDAVFSRVPSSSATRSASKRRSRSGAKTRSSSDVVRVIRMASAPTSS
jgi:hypothetical protein